jgi:hypothetical protein
MVLFLCASAKGRAAAEPAATVRNVPCGNIAVTHKSYGKHRARQLSFQSNPGSGRQIRRPDGDVSQDSVSVSGRDG